MTETVALPRSYSASPPNCPSSRARSRPRCTLLDEGATVPFIARYRKEVTDNLDDTQLRNLEERLLYLRELEDRRAAIIASIDEQGKLTDELRTAIEGADSKQVLEDLYLPYKPKRRTRAQIAREAGLAAARRCAARQSAARPANREPPRIVDAEKGVADVKAALDGARDILSETIRRNGRPARQAARLHVQSGRGCRRRWSKARRALKTRNSATTTTTRKPSARCRRIARSRCSCGRNAGVLMVKLGLGEELRRAGAPSGRSADRAVTSASPIRTVRPITGCPTLPRWCGAREGAAAHRKRTADQSARGSRSTRRSACSRAI